MDRATIEVYERDTERWIEARSAQDRDRAAAFGDWARAADDGGGPSVDLGCGPGWYSSELAAPVIGLDAAHAMLRAARERGPLLPVRADLEALPFRRGALGSAWANRSYVHVARTAMPMALADLHRSMRPGAPIHLCLFGGDKEHGPFDGDDFPGRSYSAWEVRHFTDVLHGSGYLLVELEVDTNELGHVSLVVEAVRSRTLPDLVAPGMRLLVCGLNPSVYSADLGVGYGRPGNRFWPAAIDAGIVSVDRDAVHVLRHHGVGITDLAKRATVAASELDPTEYQYGLERLERMCEWLQPGAVVFVGLAGWRAAVDRTAQPGRQERRIGGVAAYVMPSTSGLNARTTAASHAEHLRAAAALADEELASRRL